MRGDSASEHARLYAARKKAQADPSESQSGPSLYGAERLASAVGYLFLCHAPEVRHLDDFPLRYRELRQYVRYLLPA